MEHIKAIKTPTKISTTIDIITITSLRKLSTIHRQRIFIKRKKALRQKLSKKRVEE